MRALLPFALAEKQKSFVAAAPDARFDRSLPRPLLHCGATTHNTRPVSTDIAIALVTCPPERAGALATALVEARVAACVNIVPVVRSLYRWQDQVHDDAEALLLIKHPRDGFAALKAAVLAHHPYELPEVIAVGVDEAHQPYLDWIRSACCQAPPPSST